MHLECSRSAPAMKNVQIYQKTEVAILMRLGTGILRADFSSFESADRVHDKWCGKI